MAVAKRFKDRKEMVKWNRMRNKQRVGEATKEPITFSTIQNLEAEAIRKRHKLSNAIPKLDDGKNKSLEELREDDNA